MKTSEEDSVNFERLIYDNLNKFAFPLANNLELFAFAHRKSLVEHNGHDADYDGWNVYDATEEYQRMVC